MNRSVGLGIAAVVLAGVMLWWWGARQTAPAELPAEAPEEEPAAAEPVPEQPPAAEATAPGQVPAQAPAAEPAAPAEAPPPSVQPEPPSAPMGQVAALKGAFERDPVDPQAIEAERKLRALFGTAEVPLEMLERVRCRKRACKLELIWLPDEPFAFMGAGMQIATKIHPEIAIEPRKPDAKGVLRYDLYVPREGYTGDNLGAAPEPAGPKP
jgi:hypothetical protein